jgi:hypothetical protein
MFVSIRGARRVAAVGAAGLLVCAGSGVALGAATHKKPPKPSIPKAGTSWFSKKPNVSISVLKPAKHVSVFISCLDTGALGDSWEGNLPLNKGSFKLNKVVKIAASSTTSSGVKFGSKRTHVFLTGTFEKNKFVGAMQITGSLCAKGSYTATFNKGGGSGK